MQPPVLGTQDVNNDQGLLIAPYLIIFGLEGAGWSQNLCPELTSNFKTKYYDLTSNVHTEPPHPRPECNRIWAKLTELADGSRNRRSALRVHSYQISSITVLVI